VRAGVRVVGVATAAAAEVIRGGGAVGRVGVRTVVVVVVVV
jgi:hypothetical protein